MTGDSRPGVHGRGVDEFGLGILSGDVRPGSVFEPASSSQRPSAWGSGSRGPWCVKRSKCSLQKACWMPVREPVRASPSAPDQFDEPVRADLELQRIVLLVAGNELLQRSEVILEPALQVRDVLLDDRRTDRSFVDARASVLEAISVRRPDSALKRMSRPMATGARDAETALARDPRDRTVLNQRAPAQRRDAAPADPLQPDGSSVI